MTELSKLELQVTLNDKGLRDFEDRGVKVAETLNKSFSELDSTILRLNRSTSEFNQSLKLMNSNKLTLNSSFLEIESTFGDLNKLSVEFGQSLEILMKNGSVFANSFDQASGNNVDGINNIREEVNKLRGDVNKLSEDNKKLQVELEKSKSLVDRIKDSSIAAGIGIALFELIRNIRSVVGTIVSIAQFIGDPSGTTNKFLTDTRTKLAPFVEGIKKIVEGLKGYGKEILKATGLTSLLEAALKMTNEQAFLLAVTIGLGILIINGRLDLLGKMFDDVFKNHILPFFRTSNESAEKFKEGINNASDALKGLENMPQELGPTPGPQQMIIIELIDPKTLEEQKRQIEELEEFKQRKNQETLELIRRNAVEQIEINKNIADKQSEFSKQATEDIKNNIEEQGQTIKEKGPIRLKDITDPRIITDPEELEQFNKEIEEQLKRSSDAINQQSNNFSILNGAIAMAGETSLKFAGDQDVMSDAVNGVMTSVVSLREKGIDPLAGQTNELADRIETASGRVEQAEGTFNTYGISLGDVNDLNKVFGVTQDQVNQSLDDGSVAFDNVGASAEGFGDTIEEVQNKGGFFEGIKQGFIDFVESVQSNSELMADFFADTLSQMSQNFSDLFFNVLTGKFDDLADLAKQAFEAILRAFLDLVSAIVTKQIVISIAGVFGFGKDAGAGDLLGFGKQAAGIGADLAGIFGGGGGAAGGILGGGAALGGGISAIGAGAGAAGGATSVGASLGLTGISSVGTGAAGGATGVGASLGLSGISSVPTAPGFLAGIGGVAGAITIVGAVLAAAALAFTIIAPFLEKTPRLDIDFDSVKTEAGRRAALVGELLDDDFLKDEIIDISVKRKAGLGLGGDEGIKDVLADAIQGAVNNLLDIINKLPTDLAETLSEELLNTPLDTETEVAGERLFEFDAKGKKIAEKFNQLINGEIQAKFLFAVDGFLQTMFESLGVLPEAAEAFLDERFEEFKNAGSREARAKVGQELLADINAFVDAFNIISGNVNDSIGQTIQSVRSLSQELGFDAVPSIGELKDKLAELLENAELDPETVQKYADLRNAIVQGISDIINSITGLIGKISQLNSTIVGLGGAAVNIIPFLDEAQAKLVDFYTTNIGNLSLGEQEMFLDEILGIANAKLAEEQAAFQRAQEARQKAEEAQRERIEKRIDNLNKEKDKINEVFNKRIEALNEELQIAESFAQLTESIRQTLDSILFSPESVLTGVEQVNALQSNIAGLQAQLTSAVDPEKQLEIAGRLEEAFKTLFDTAGDAFGVNSPEFVAIFDQVTGGLESLADFTGERGRSVEEISAEIERLTAVNEATLKSIDAKIEAAQERLANIGQSTADNTFHASQELTELFEFIRSEYIRILEERFAQLGEVSEFGFQTEVEGLGVIAGFTEENLTVLKGVGEEAAKHTGYLADIAGRLGALAGFQHGSEGFKNFGRGTLAVLHGLEAVVTKKDIAGIQESLLSQIAGGGIGGLADRLAGERDGRDGLSRGGFIAGMRPGGGFVPEFPLSGTRPTPDEPVNHVTEMSVDINVNVNGGSQASLASLAGEIENMMVRSIRQGRVRKELQEAAVRRIA